MISIIDYGVGNLRSVEKAFQLIGTEAKVTSDKNEILNSDGIVLPGVGAFKDGMDRLGKSGFVELIKKIVERGTPLLGICLGMQLLFDYSEEGGDKVLGLGILKGSIKLIPSDNGLKVPHMGWNSLNIKKDADLFKNIKNTSYVYFVHSYYLTADNTYIVAATTNYGVEVHAAVSYNNIFGTQFHPEKSGEVGLEILKNFSNTVVNN